MTSRGSRSAVDMAAVQEFAGRVLQDQAAAISALLVRIGDELGLYRAMAGAGPMTAAELTDATGTDRRYVEEWLGNQAAGGYVRYDPVGERFELPESHAAVLAREDSAAFMAGGFESIAGLFAAEERLLAAFRTGAGLGWHEHDERVFRGCERFFKPGYLAHLADEWLPALDGVVDKLRRGARVADVGCGHGASTLVMARAFPRSTFVGFDYHEGSVRAASQRAKEHGLDDRVRFARAGAKEIPADGYDLVCFFDCLHDMGDPVGAVRHVRDALAPDGTVMLVEPFAGDRLEENLGPVGRVYYGFSTACCTPASRAQEVGLGLGAQAGEARLREVFVQAGYRHFRRAAESPVNLVLEARP